MSEPERMLLRLGKLLGEIARPHLCGDALPAEVTKSLWEVGLPCNELTPREELIAGLWARKRMVLTAMRPDWGGHGLTPPGAA